MARVPRRESASPVPRGVTKYGVYHSIHLRAILFYCCTTLGLVILKPSDKDGFRISTVNGADPVPPNVASLLTTVLRVVVSKPRLSRLLAFIQCHPFPLGQLPQPGKVPAPGARLGEILFESLTFQTA